MDVFRVVTWNASSPICVPAGAAGRLAGSKTTVSYAKVGRDASAGKLMSTFVLASGASPPLGRINCAAVPLLAAEGTEPVLFVIVAGANVDVV